MNYTFNANAPFTFNLTNSSYKLQCILGLQGIIDP